MDRYRQSEADLNEAKLRAIREGRQQSVIDSARSTGYSSAGQPVVGFSDSRTPLVTGNSGLHGGNPRTNDLTWANQFRRNDNQIQSPAPLSASPAASPSAAAPSITQGVLNEILPLNPFANSFATSINLGNGADRYRGSTQFGASAPSISTLAQGGQNHAQRWSQSLANPQQGQRRPYIGGANNQNVAVDYSAGGKFSSYKPNSDPTLDRFTFASAFR